MSDEVRSVRLTGGALLDYTEGGKTKKRTAKKKQEGGLNAGSTDSSTWLRTPSASASASAPAPAPAPASPIIKVDTETHLLQPQGHIGGVKQIRVELKKKSITNKVKLNPKKAEKLKKKHTKKVRKISLGISSFHKRMTRAKKLEKKVSDMSLDKLKEHLINNKLIKASSKAPESVLRQIAADSQLVAKKVL